MKKFVSAMVATAAAVLLVSCGGGSSGTITGSRSGSGGGTPPPPTPTYSMGNGSGSSFQTQVIGISNASLSAGGTTSLQVSIVDQTGTLYTGAAVTITFNSTCISQGLASVTASGTSSAGPNPNTVVTSTGTADATYAAKGCSGSDVMTASAAVAGANLTATGTVTVAAASTGSIEFESATPTAIGLKGTGLPATSTVVFKVLDATGAPKPGVDVDFTLDSAVGGLTLSPSCPSNPSALSCATSAADGTVHTVVSSGTVATTVTVTAAISSAGLTTQSSVLTVTTGIPTSNAFSIAVGAAQYGSGGTANPPACPNVEGYGTDGVVVPVTVRLSDRYKNPVLDGTAVTFYTDGGQIVGSCTTTGGACTANWTSANPRPQTTDSPPSLKNGRAVILATATGEEAFTDTNGDGFWESGEVFQDLGEPFDDANENGTYDMGEHFLDYNHDGQRNGPSGSFIGITCTGTSPGSTCTTSTLAIGAQHLIIMSTALANLACGAPGGFGGSCAGGLTIASGGNGSIPFNVQDQNGNPIAAGSTIAVTADSSIGTVSSTTSSFIEGCSSSTTGTNFTSFFTAAKPTTPPVTGNLTIEVTSAGTKSVSLFTIPVTVN